MKRLKWIACAATIAGSLATTSKARAQFQLAADFDIGVPVGVSDQENLLNLVTGAGFDVRFGYRLRIPRTVISVTPELAGGYTDLDARLVRVRPGLRVGVGRLLVPYVYGHVGWGWTSFERYSRVLGDGSGPVDPPRFSGHGAVFDAGLGLDLHVLRRLSIGAHAGYNVVSVRVPKTLDPLGSSPSKAAKWFNFGLNAAVFF